MSTRLALNIALGTASILLLGSIGAAVMSLGDRNSETVQVQLALQQQELIQDLNQDAADLAAADNLLAVNQARSEMGRTIIRIDHVMKALGNGGKIEDSRGATINIDRVKNKTARAAVEEAAAIWLETGLPLADLAAGEFSIFSAAGQEAVATLTRNSPTLANQMGIAAAALQEDTQAQLARASYARTAVIAFGLIFGALALARFRTGRRQETRQPAASTHSGFPAADGTGTQAPAQATPPEPAPAPAGAPVQPLDWSRHSGNTYVSPVDFDTVNASVDQLTVDMNTIAGSTDKMRLAIDSVGHALQGMLYSLNEMAQDTAEGYKIVRGANNAASYTASTAAELAASAREMSQVVSRVTQLALKTKQVAAQIDAEAVSTGSTGEAFTSVVANEVKGLAKQTSTATSEIENTVSGILAIARQYEEAIGQIIKNISAINKVSQNLGELMLNPPPAGVAGTPLPGAQPLPLDPGATVPTQTDSPADVPEPAPSEPAAGTADPEVVEESPAEPVAEAEDESWAQDPSPEEVAEETSAAIKDAAAEENTEKDAGSDETVADTAEPSGSAGNVFMLGGKPKKPRKNLVIPEAKTPEENPAAEPAATEPKAEDQEKDKGEDKTEDGGSNIFMLNKPKKTEQPEPTGQQPEAKEEPSRPEPEPAPEEPAPKAEEEAKEEDSGSNIFMLNKPKKPAAAKPAADESQAKEKPAEPEPEKAEEPAAEKEPVTVPAAGEEPDNDGGSNANIFMLNKPKK